jgi:hypothetical protein
MKNKNYLQIPKRERERERKNSINIIIVVRIIMIFENFQTKDNKAV